MSKWPLPIRQWGCRRHSQLGGQVGTSSVSLCVGVCQGAQGTHMNTCGRERGELVSSSEGRGSQCVPVFSHQAALPPRCSGMDVIIAHCESCTSSHTVVGHELGMMNRATILTVPLRLGGLTFQCPTCPGPAHYSHCSRCLSGIN